MHIDLQNSLTGVSYQRFPVHTDLNGALRNANSFLSGQNCGPGRACFNPHFPR